MSWWQRLFGSRSSSEWKPLLLRLRTTRFRQLLRNYGKLLWLLDDAAEKQAGDYVLDRQYVIALAAKLLDLTDAILLDLNAMTERGHLALYDRRDQLGGEIDQLLDPGRASTTMSPDGTGAVGAGTSVPPSSVDREALSRVIADARPLYRGAGLVVCRGLAVGPVFNLDRERDLARLPAQAILVASRLEPPDDASPHLRRAAAVLIETGKSSGPTASLVRESRIPTIVELPGVAQQLGSGTQVTVDADENTIYPGRLQALVDYYRAERVGSDEEPEYRLLRELRRTVFPLTSATERQSAPGAAGCRTVHDLVYLAQHLAADVVVALLSAAPVNAGAATEIDGGAAGRVRLVDLGGALDLTAADAAAPSIAALRSTPLRALLAGFVASSGPAEHPIAAPDLDASLLAAARKDQACILVRGSGATALIDAQLIDDPEANHVYCQFWSSDGAGDGSAARVPAWSEPLARHKFAIAEVAGGATAWIDGRSATETSALLQELGSMCARLVRPAASGRSGAAAEEKGDAGERRSPAGAGAG